MATAAANARFLPVRAFANAHPWPKARTLRHWLFVDLDGFRARCTRTIGRSIVLDVEAVWAWINEHADMRARGSAVDGPAA